MDQDANESFPRAPTALVVLTAIVYAASIATVVAWFALLLLEQPRAAPPRAAVICGVCGVVQAVRELEPQAGQMLEGSLAEGTVFMIAALSGAREREPRPRRIYETAVLLDDGFLRVVHDTRLPEWLRGDRVKVIMGRVVPAEANGAVEPAGAPEGRMLIPVLPIARAP